MRASVHKLRVPVRLSQPNQEPRDGWFLLFPRADGAERPESIVELLNSSRIMLPFIQFDEPTILLLTRSDIDWVAIGSNVSNDLVMPRERTVTHEQRVEVRFADESRVDGLVQWDASKRNLQLSDFLDWCDDFFVLKTGFGTLVVNRQRIRGTRVVDNAPRPADADTLGV